MITRRGAAGLLEGRFLWGDFRIGTPGRSGWMTYRLTVYPPGTNAAERRAWQFWNSWPLLGALLCLVGFATLGNLVGAAVLVPTAIVVYVGGVVVGWVVTKRLRPGVIRLNVAQFPDNGDIQTLGDLAALSRALERLQALDDEKAAGRVSELAYEQEWGAVYRALGSVTEPQRARRR